MTEETPAKPATGSDVPPDRLAISPRSPWFNQDVLIRGVGIRFKGVVRTNVEEYSISEGWVRVQAVTDSRLRSSSMVRSKPGSKTSAIIRRLPRLRSQALV